MANRILVKRVKDGYEYHFRQSSNNQDWKPLSLEMIVNELRAERFTIADIKRMIVIAHAEASASWDEDKEKYMLGVFVGAFVACRIEHTTANKKTPCTKT